MISRRVSALLLCTFAPLTGCNLPYREATSVDLQYYQDALSKSPDTPLSGQTRFTFDDFSALSTENLDNSALPWKWIATGMYLHEKSKNPKLPAGLKSVRKVLQKYGLMTPKKIENWLGPQPRFADQPLGMVRGTIRIREMNFKLEVADFNCAACHSSMTYDAQGNPTGNAWLGSPNTSLDLERYFTTLYQVMRETLRDQETFLTTLKTIFPSTTSSEIFTYKTMLFPMVKKRLDSLDKTTRRFVAFSLGGPGLINGIGAMKRILGLVDPGAYHRDEAAFVSIPDYSDLAFRSSICWDGIYGVPGAKRFEKRTTDQATPQKLYDMTPVVLTFPVQAMGLQFKRMGQNEAKVREVLHWIAQYRGPQFPGKIEIARAQRGSQVFEQKCAGCHGHYQDRYAEDGRLAPRLVSFPNFLMPQAKNGTDPTRWNLGEKALEEAKKTTLGKYVDLQITGGYVAPRLTNVWMTAPYLHNGSVPTVWHLLHPESRPKKFQVGGHRLNFDRLGIDGEIGADGVYRYPNQYQPWSEPSLYDTSLPGRSNAGHDRQIQTLTEDEKSDVMEYLKVL